MATLRPITETRRSIYPATPLYQTMLVYNLSWDPREELVNGEWTAETQWISQTAKKKSGHRSIICCIFGMLVALIWRGRNLLRFQHTQFLPDKIYREIAQHVHNMQKQHQMAEDFGIYRLLSLVYFFFCCIGKMCLVSYLLICMYELAMTEPGFSLTGFKI